MKITIERTLYAVIEIEVDNAVEADKAIEDAINGGYDHLFIDNDNSNYQIIEVTP